jgi:hypothetical protein
MNINHFLLKAKVAISGADIAIVITNNKIQVVRGEIRPALGTTLTEMFNKNHIKNGLILAYHQKGGYKLTFSKEIAQQRHQSIRNVWGIYY